MKISEQYGPQFDSTDGTIGPKVQCVRRYVLEKGDGGLFFPRQGRHTFATLEEAKGVANAFIANYPPEHPDHGRYVKGLHPVAWWCYPGHFDPCGPCE